MVRFVEVHNYTRIHKREGIGIFVWSPSRRAGVVVVEV